MYKQLAERAEAHSSLDSFTLYTKQDGVVGTGKILQSIVRADYYEFGTDLIFVKVVPKKGTIEEVRRSLKNAFNRVVLGPDHDCFGAVVETVTGLKRLLVNTDSSEVWAISISWSRNA